jgi:hypothetical protein
MKLPPRIEHAQRWLWGMCLVAFLVGIGLGWRSIEDVPPAPARTDEIPASVADHIVLTHPFPTRPDPATPPGSLLYSLFPTDPKLETSLAEEVHPAGFGLSDPWVMSLLDKKLPNINHAFAFRMRGQIRFMSAVNHLHLRSDNGYRITFRDAEGHEAHMDDWENSVTDDFYFKVIAEPGCYDIEIDFCNIHGNAYFDMWSEAKDIVFYPAEPTAKTETPAKPGP